MTDTAVEDKKAATPANVGFVIPTCLRQEQHAKALVNCLRAIRRFHTNALVVVVCDSVPCDGVEHDVSIAKSLASYWVPNPFPASGEFGAAHVAAHLRCPVLPTYVACVHDSTTLRRPITNADTANIKRGWMPLWYAEKRHMCYNPCDSLLSVVTHGLTDATQRERWAQAANDPRRMYVAFGSMGIGTPEAWSAIWKTGLKHVRHHIRTRDGRCEFERLLPYAACVAEVSPTEVCLENGAPVYNTLALCGDIFRHPSMEKQGVMVDWDAPEAVGSAPALWKTWFSR